MLTLNLFDDNFAGRQFCSVANQVPKTLRYVHNMMQFDGITIFTDGNMFGPYPDVVKSKHKVGWLHEGYELHPENYRSAMLVADKFDFIMTTEQSLVDYNPAKFRKIIRGGTWVTPPDWGIYPKTKTVSMILSEKTELPGHRLRQAVASALPHHIDIYGYRGRPSGPQKRWAYKDYMFAVVIEASNREDWFSEHLLDCIAYGTIPLYWGCPNIGEYLDGRGLIYLVEDLLDELAESWLPRLNKEFYESFLVSGFHNLERLQDYAVTEDWFVRNVLTKEFGL